MRKKKIKQLWVLILTLIMLVGTAPAAGIAGCLSLTASAAKYSGVCGPSLTWTFNTATGEMVISGYGEMEDYYSPSLVPWHEYRADIKTATIGNAVTGIHSYAFYGCTALKNINIGNSVSSIGGGAFSNTAYYNDANNWENGVLYIGKYLIEAKKSLAGAYVVKKGTLYICDYAFADCEGLTDIIIGDSVINIGNGAFAHCDGLTGITIPDGVSIGNFVFEYCKGLTDVTIPDSVTKVGRGAFRYCTNLTDATTGNGVTIIWDSTFEGCSSLAGITIGRKVTDIGYGAFAGCTSLKDVYYAGSREQWEAVNIDYNTAIKSANIHCLNIPYISEIISIRNYVPARTVDYKTTITFHADPGQNTVDGGEIHWFINDTDELINGTYTVTKARESFTVQAKYVKDGEVLEESEVERVNVKTDFFARLAAFFRSIFGTLPKVEQSLPGADMTDGAVN